jgi:hypothetical protein
MGFRMTHRSGSAARPILRRLALCLTAGCTALVVLACTAEPTSEVFQEVVPENRNPNPGCPVVVVSTLADGTSSPVTLFCGVERFIEIRGQPVDPSSRACYEQGVSLQDAQGQLHPLTMVDGPNDLPRSVGDFKSTSVTVGGGTPNGNYLVVPGGVGCAWTLTIH